MSALIRLIILVFLISGCTNSQQTNFDNALELFRQNKLDQARPLLEEEIAQNTDNAEAYVWLAETYRRLEMKDEAIRTAKKALVFDSCNSFAHTVIAEASRRCHWKPRSDSDSNWVHLNHAIQCDSLDGNAWVSIWGETILRGKFDLMYEAIRKMKETGFLTKAALSYGRWMLRTLPDSAILITNGDMDSFPLLAVQETEGFRKDVVVAERGLLGTGQYLRFIQDYNGIPLPFSETQLDSLLTLEESREDIYLISGMIIKGWMNMQANSSLTRPIALAVTVDESFYADIKDHLRYDGPFLLWHTSPVSETQSAIMLEKSLEGIRAENFSGPWVSDRDRSPIRRIYTKYLANNITSMALSYCDELIEIGKLEKALEVLNWAEEFETITVLGPVSTEEISQRRKLVKERQN